MAAEERERPMWQDGVQADTAHWRACPCAEAAKAWERAVKELRQELGVNQSHRARLR